jgi:hypothetical protein
MGGVGRDVRALQIAATGVVELQHLAGIAHIGFVGGDLLDVVVLPQAAAVAEGANTRLRRNAGAGQDDDGPRAIHGQWSTPLLDLAMVPNRFAKNGRVPWGSLRPVYSIGNDRSGTRSYCCTISAYALCWRGGHSTGEPAMDIVFRYPR